MTPSPAHAAAVLAALRLPALIARQALLEAGAGNITIDLYPESGAAVLASIIQADPTALDPDGLRIVFTPGIEGIIVAGGVATWGRIHARTGAAWADVTVSDVDGEGDIKLTSTSLGVGAFARLTSAVIQG